MKKPAPPSAPVGFDPARLIELHQAGVWRYLRALGCDVALAEDLTQETFLAVFQKPFQDYDPAATAGYLRKVAFHQLVTYRRRTGRVTTVADVEEVDLRWSRWASEDNGEALLEALRQCLQGLSQRARQALDMRFAARESRASIAASLAITEHGAKNLMQRAKKQLRSCIEGKMR